MVYAKRVHGLRNETGARPGYEPAVGCIRWGYRCPVLINEYRRGDSGTMDALYLDGTVPVFFFICWTALPRSGHSYWYRKYSENKCLKF